jgi:hypothetical protein
MSIRFRALALVFVSAPLFSLACGDDGTTGSGGAGAGGDTGSGGGGPAECKVITQADTASTLSSVFGVGFPYAPSAAGPEPEIITVSPAFVGAFSAGSYELTGPDVGPAGGVVVFASEDAVTQLIGRDPAAMDGRLFAGTAGVAKIDVAPSYGTQFQGRVKGTLSKVVLRELDDALTVIDGGECLYLASAEFDAGGADAACNAPTDPASAPSGGACIADYLALGHDCNPVTNDGCMAGETCDLNGNFKCAALAGGEAALCGACDNANSQYCGLGMTCDSYGDTGKCFRYCCTDADCGTGNTCIAYGALYVGVCMTGAP